MCGNGSCSPWYCIIGILVAIAWWLFASGLLLCAWNSVVASIANVKKAKYWQALVIVLALVVLFGPFAFGRHMGAGGRHHCEWCQGGKASSDCGPMKMRCGSFPCDSTYHQMAPKTGE